jgi:TatA/E family protein of Tat protein translocase
MFDFGMGELVVIFAVALIVFGPDKLPEIARGIGKGLHSLKKSFDEVKVEVQTGLDEIKDTSGIKEALNEGAAIKKSLQDMTEQVKTDFKDAVDVSITESPINTPTKNIADKEEDKTDEGSSGTSQ